MALFQCRVVTPKDYHNWPYKVSYFAVLGYILDTYEKVTATKDLVEWIESQLLAEAGECEQLRFLIGGQKVPDSRDARWRDLAEQMELDRIVDQRIWKKWIHEINPNVDDKHIEGIVVGLDGVPESIRTALETFAKKFGPIA